MDKKEIEKDIIELINDYNASSENEWLIEYKFGDDKITLKIIGDEKTYKTKLNYQDDISIYDEAIIKLINHFD